MSSFTLCLGGAGQKLLILWNFHTAMSRDSIQNGAEKTSVEETDLATQIKLCATVMSRKKHPTAQQHKATQQILRWMAYNS